MTVKELIEKLRTLDENLIVNVGTHDVYETVIVKTFIVRPGFPGAGTKQVSISAS